MTIVCDFDNIQAMARAVGASANSVARHKYTLRLWNRFQPENTLWWLVPSTERPAYPHGKGIVSPGDSLRPDQVFCGMHVEKGFNPIVAEAYPRVRHYKQILEPTWSWHHTLRGLGDGSFADAVESIRRASGEPVYIEVATWYSADLSDFDPYSLSVEGDGECRSPIDGGQVWFSVDGEALSLEMALCLQNVTRPLTHHRSLAELAKILSQPKELGWCWLDFSIGTMVWLARNAPEKSGSYWTANDVWDKLIHPWHPWML